MPNVLIIGYFWPYRRGSKRVIGLAKYLPEFGWQPIILTAPLDERPEPQFRFVETPYVDALGFYKKLFGVKLGQDFRKHVKTKLGVAPQKSPVIDFILTRCAEIVNYPDPERGWKPFALKAMERLRQEENLGAVISIWPVTCHFVARELKNRSDIPWIADFPDLWSLNHNFRHSPLRNFLDRRLELKTLARADALITTSEPLAEELRALHKTKSIYSITHGFDPAAVNIPPAKLTAKFTVTYTGTIYTGKQDVSRLFCALRDLVADGIMNPDDIEVRFYGSELEWLDVEIEQYGLSNIVKQCGIIPHDTAVERQRESQLLLLLDWDDAQEKGVYTGKIFEYLGAYRPILATGGIADNIVDVLLGETNAGIHAPTYEDIEGALKKLYQEYKPKGEVIYRGKEPEVSKYSQREMARKFAEILDNLGGEGQLF